ncbi:MAG: LuxR C-terminal-related transcriptional regulator [Bacteroidales bacterium]|nr:LuxR C-terminal-related transcriptional regulator [Bacteroidales bacterium]
MAAENKKKVLIVTPSALLAKGFEALLSSAGEFRLGGVVSCLQRLNEVRFRDDEFDVVLVDPSIFDYPSRMDVRHYLPESDKMGIVAVKTVFMTDEELGQYDASVGLFDHPVAIIKKLRDATEVSYERPKTGGEALSSREKEILVCVAKGLLNKEIADQLNLSIYTVITHRKNITRKTGIRSVAGLTVYALLNKLIEPESVE